MCAQVFDICDGGAAFLDSGWTDPLCTCHMGHVVPGSFHRFDDSWGATLPEGDCFFLERPELKPEGDRDLARWMIEEEFGIELR